MTSKREDEVTAFSNYIVSQLCFTLNKRFTTQRKCRSLDRRDTLTTRQLTLLRKLLEQTPYSLHIRRRVGRGDDGSGSGRSDG